MKPNQLFPGLLLTLTLQAGAAEVSGQMLLRDAHYWYDVPVDSLASNSFLGVGCDSLQVVLDVRDGHVDIATADVESASTVEREDFVLYPDAITAEAQMFSYLLYGRSGLKVFRFYDRSEPSTEGKVGTMTAFVYCLSTRPEAYIRAYDGNTGFCIRSNGGSSVVTYRDDGHSSTYAHSSASTVCD